MKLHKLFSFTVLFYGEWNEYQENITFINDFSSQQKLFSAEGTLLETF